MPSSEAVNLASMDRKNLPHIASDLSLLQPEAVMNGLYRFFHKDQAYNLPVSNRYHQVQPVAQNPNAFSTSSSTNYFDFNIPMQYWASSLHVQSHSNT